MNAREREIVFIHVGKTGGTTASIDIRNHKRKENLTHEINPDFQIAQQVKQIFHVRKPKIDGYKSFIITSRNPVDRMISWFIYAHPKNGLLHTYDKSTELFDCYDQVDDLVTYGLQRQTNDTLKTTSGKSCQELAQNVVQGKPSFYLHMARNYEYYTSDILKETSNEIFLLRTEYFWPDWQKINFMLGGGSITKRNATTHREGKEGNMKVTSRSISDEGLKNACYFLCREIQLYKELLNRAVNLSMNDKMRSFQNLKESCPIETESSTC